MSERPPDPPVPQVRDVRPKILGVLPQNAQARLLAGIAVLMVIVIAFSGKNAPKDRAASKPAVPPPEANQAQIQDYRTRIEAESQKLAAEEAELAHTKEAVRQVEPGTAPRAGWGGPTAGLPAAEPDPFGQERAKREYRSLFASNVALSYRAAVSQSARPGAWPDLPVVGEAPAPVPTSAAPAADKPKYRLFEGTLLETVLTNRLDSTFSGPVNCMVTTNVYSRDGGHLLIPQGSRVLGEVRKLEALGQQRLAVTFHRLLMPDGYSVSLDQFHGLDQIGETGLRDVVNHHYVQMFGVSLALGAFAGLAQVNTRYSLDESATDAYRQGVTSSLSQSAVHILDRYLNVLPTFTIREGYRVKVYLSGDLLLPAYEDHPVRRDF